MSPKVLHVTLWPGPPFFGGNIFAYNFLKRLTTNHRAKLIILLPYESTVEASSNHLYRLGIANEAIEVIRLREVTLWDRVRGFAEISRLPYVSYLERTIGPVLREVVGRILIDWEPDSLVVWYWPVAALLANVEGVRKVVSQYDSVSLANRIARRASGGLLRRAYHGLLAGRCRRYEQTILPRYDEVVFISQRDANHATLPSSVSVTVICNGVDTEGLKPSNDSRAGSLPPVIVFHGALSYGPNAECVRFLVYDLGKRLEDALGAMGFQISIIGGGATREQLRFFQRYPWLRHQGYVQDLAPALCAGSLYVAPIRTGAGVKNKVLDAMACGLPIIGTPEAFGGLDIKPGTHCVICPLHDIPDRVLELIADAESCRALGTAAREWVVRNADWEVQAALFEQVIHRTKDQQNPDDPPAEQSRP
jgi:glycosyltransferase involved in cell wall biosynthesis